MAHKIPLKNLWQHAPKREGLLKFLLLLSVLIGYFGYLSYEYGLATGGMVAALTWSFFVLCTPIADAGFLLDFPVRLITGMRMLYSELIVWTIAISLNTWAVFFSASSYDKTFLTDLLHKILTHPWPYWSIIALCASGTFLSVKFGDEMMDVIAHKDRKILHKHGFTFKVIAMIAFFLLIVWSYYHLIETLNVDIPDV
jgi:hypothetical protein